MNIVFGYFIGAIVTTILLYAGHGWYEYRKGPSQTIDRVKIHSFMTQRFHALQKEIDRDKGGGLSDSLAKWQEVKYWKEAIERNVFDCD